MTAQARDIEHPWLPPSNATIGTRAYFGRLRSAPGLSVYEVLTCADAELCCPPSPKPALRLPTGGAMSPQRGSPQRVLVVDDNQDAATSLATLLRGLGFDAVATFDALDAVTLAAEFEPDVVISDLQMPHVDGYELGRSLAALKRRPRLVALSADNSAEALSRSRASGFAVHLCKPCALEEVLRALGRPESP